MPADITGTDIIQESGEGGRREFEFVKGPVFANLLLADEINRAPAKTQSAMLEAMQEHKVTVLGRTYQLQPPFFVLATQNPIEQEGTYPLPEAQLDRFMFLIELDYPNEDEEIRIARETTGTAKTTLSHLIDGEKVLAYQPLVRRVPVPDPPRPTRVPAVDQGYRGLGCWPSCRAVSHPRRQVSRRPARFLHGLARGPRSGGAFRSYPPRPDQLRCRVARHDFQEDHPASGRGNARSMMKKPDARNQMPGI